VTLASEADKVVIVLGTNPVINGQIGQDREKYGLPSAQIALFEAVKKRNTRRIFVDSTEVCRKKKSFEIQTTPASAGNRGNQI